MRLPLKPPLIAVQNCQETRTCPNLKNNGGLDWCSYKKKFDKYATKIQEILMHVH